MEYSILYKKLKKFIVFMESFIDICTFIQYKHLQSYTNNTKNRKHCKIRSCIKSVSKEFP